MPVCTRAQPLQSRLPLWDPMDCSRSGSSLNGILQGVATPRPPPGDLPNTETAPASPALQVDCLPTEPPGKPPNLDTFPLNN